MDEEKIDNRENEEPAEEVMNEPVETLEEFPDAETVEETPEETPEKESEEIIEEPVEENTETPVEEPIEVAEEAPAPQEKKNSGVKAAIIVLTAVCLVLSVATISLFVLFFSLNHKVERLEKNVNKTSTSQSTKDQTLPDVSPVADLNYDSSDSPTVKVAAACSPSVVSIKITMTGGSGSGSGVVWSSDGYIVTNNHVVEDALTVVVIFADGSEYQAQVIATDPENDLALLRINATGLIPVVPGDSDDIVVGELAVAIGNPLGTLANTVTDGIVSALARDISIEGNVYHVMQISCAINPGNSGGGCFNGKGELIGIVNSKKYASGIEGLAFAIPVNTVKASVAEMIKGDDTTLQKSLGVTNCYEVTAENYSDYGSSSYLSKLEQLNGGPLYGVYIYGFGQVEYAAGSEQLVSGDVLVEIDGKTVNDLSDVRAVVESKEVGDTVTLKVCRLMSSGYFSTRYSLEQKEITVKVVLMYR